ncbi:MAG TPA: sensor histidine kinase KdpD [Candidatus Eisenbacteria bacterium]
MRQRDPKRDPEALLAQLRQAQARESQGKLKIFFGAAAGVGKTYAMLVEAHERKRAGADVVAGVVETHGRAETAALLEGLETVPLHEVEYRGTVLREFGLDAALARRPGLLLLDELAHTNAPGSRHAKRWQDVEELLIAGIDVYTTLNVQHVESLWDAVAEITGVHVRETVPDSIIDRADEIEIVDLPVDDLLQRLREGKVYIAPQIESAIQNFFRKDNLIALRELALRRTAERVDAQMEPYRRMHERHRATAGGRLLVCIGKPATAPKLVRAARRMAASLRVPWTALYVERPGRSQGSPKDEEYISDVLSFAEELGADTAILSGLRISDEILAYARERNASRIVVGKPSRPRWKEMLFGSLANSLIRESQDIDVYVIRGDVGEERESPKAGPEPSPQGRAYGRAIATVAVCSAVAWLMRPYFELSNLIMVYLLGVIVVAVGSGRGPAIVASVLSVAAFDFFFVPPFLTFAVSDTQYLVTFAVMLAAALVLSTMASRLREQTRGARDRERRAAALYKLSRDLADRQDVDELLGRAVETVEDIFASRAVILVPDANARVGVRAGDASLLGPGGHDHGVAQWVFDRGEWAGLGTHTLPGAQALFIPLKGSHGAAGVLGIRPANVRTLLRPDQFALLETCASQTALALERAELAAQAERSRVQIEAERLRNTLLSSVSHDLRTPLAAITGATSSLLEEGGALAPETRRELVESIGEEAARLNRLVGNLLDMSRLESGALKVQKEWHSLEEVIGAALERLGSRLDGRSVDVRLPDGLGLVPLDDVLIQQVVYNLVENALKYTPAGSPIEVRADSAPGEVWVEVADRGPGLPPGEEQRVFEKFYRLREANRPGGIGLGLTIARGIVEAHGGTMTAGNRPEGGAWFRFSLPVPGEPPRLEPEPGEAGADATGGAGVADHRG